MRRYSRCPRNRTKTHDKATISHDISHYSRYQTAFLKLEEIIRNIIYTTKAPMYFGAFAFFIWFAGLTISDHLAELRLAKVKPLPFGLKTTLSCFYGFAAVLTVQKR